MTHLLTKYPFSEADIALPEVQAFHCGDEPWDLEVAEWIKSRTGDNSVLVDVNTFGTEVWLYREAGTLIGYASLGERMFTWPLRSKKKELVSVIPFIGVQKQFQGEPRDAERDDKYAYQILDDLLANAAEKAMSGKHFALVTLSVDDRNKRAIRFYECREFVDLKIPRLDPDKGITYTRMARGLDDLVAELRAEAADAPPQANQDPKDEK